MLALAVALAVSPVSADVDLVAHRGYLGWGAPENTHASMRHAVQKGFEGVEFDVRFTRDGKAVLLHDSTLDRTTTCTGRLKDFDLEELEDCDASLGTVKAKVPTYESTTKYVQKLSSSITVFVHVKETLSSSKAKTLISGARLLSNEESRVVFLTEDDDNAVTLRKAGWDGKDEGRTHKRRVGGGITASSDVERIGQMVHTTTDWQSVLAGNLFDLAVTHGTLTPDYDAVITTERVEAMKAAKKQLIPVVDYPHSFEELLGLGVDGVVV